MTDQPAPTDYATLARYAGHTTPLRRAYYRFWTYLRNQELEATNEQVHELAAERINAGDYSRIPVACLRDVGLIRGEKAADRPKPVDRISIEGILPPEVAERVEQKRLAGYSINGQDLEDLGQANNQEWKTVTDINGSVRMVDGHHRAAGIAWAEDAANAQLVKDEQAAHRLRHPTEHPDGGAGAWPRRLEDGHHRLEAARALIAQEREAQRLRQAAALMPRGGDTPDLPRTRRQPHPWQGTRNPLTAFACGSCGALVDLPQKPLHEAWHERIGH